MSDLFPRNHIARVGITLRHLFPAAIGRAEVPQYPVTSLTSNLSNTDCV